MNLLYKKFIIGIFITTCINFVAEAQVTLEPDRSLLNLLTAPDKEDEDDEEKSESDIIIEEALDESADVSFADMLFEEETDSVMTDTIVKTEPMKFLPYAPLPLIAFMPTVFDSIAVEQPHQFTDVNDFILSDDRALDWVRTELDRTRRYRELKHRFMVEFPHIVKYNLCNLPEPPKQYSVAVDPSKSTITITEIITEAAPTVSPDKLVEDIQLKNWLHSFNGSLQFSQAYISPNWYQGGNNNVNMIGQAVWNVKLNPAFHPRLIAEATTQYKLAMASAPQDTVHSYLISEDLFQFNGTLGLKAFDNWYYSLTGMFKTQLLNNYKSNSNEMKAAFMSPGELNLGIGMTYNKTNPKKTFRVDVSIAPLSYNLKISTNRHIPVTNFGIDEGHRTVSEIGSNAEVKLKWDIMWNISYNSRLFLFSNYEYLQGDWQHTFNFSFNRYLSSQLYVHLRYDSEKPPVEGTKWHRWQLKEILSFGFQYQFKTI